MSAERLDFSNRVVIITGAGGGLGRCYAIAFAKRGAKVVVNDLGGTMSGDGTSTKAADLVVQEIKALNGIAIVNYDSVEEGEKIVKATLSAFGRIDIIVNNAGILRDKSFVKTSDLDWDLVHRVHLRGSFILTRAAWPHMQANNYGRIIMTSSGAGIYGNFGQANYSSAKLGLLGLSNTLSIEGQKYNITCNTIAPVARSRLTESVLPDDMLDTLKPEYVSPLVVYLCHDNTTETGSLFECGGGWIGKVRWQKSSGAVLLPSGKSDTEMTPEDVRDKWSDICSFDHPMYHTTITEASNHCINAQTDASSPSTPSASSDESSGGGKTFEYATRDVILYNLSLGATTSVPNELKFLYENHSDFCALPTFGVIPAFSVLFDYVASLSLPNGLEINPSRILHGEQYLELFQTIQATSQSKLTIKPSLVDVLDKGSGAVLIINVDTFNETQEKVAFNQFVVFCSGSGGFGGPRESSKQIKSATTFDKSARSPDAVVVEKTSVDQAALYRLNGDLNPLHIDPDFGKALGFQKPILHGLCSFGIAVKHVLNACCEGDVKLFKSVKARFSKPVIPGQTLETSMWVDEASKRVYFETKVLETKEAVVTAAYVDLHDIRIKPKPVEIQQTEQDKNDVPFASDKIFDEISVKMKQNPELAKQINSVYEFHISNGKSGGSKKIYLVDLKQAVISRKQSTDKSAECIIMLSDDDFVKLASGKANAQQMFMKGQLKIKGKIMLAQKLNKLFKVNSKL